MLAIKEITWEDDISWDELIKGSNTATFFQTKAWLTLWMKHWGKNIKIIIYAVYDGDELVGIAPLMISDKINLLGVPDPSESGSLSDFGDIIIKTGREKEVWSTVIKEFKIKNSKLRIELNYIREESPSLNILKELGGKAEEMDVSPVIKLPKTWDEYLSTLDRHDRHELRRKIRKAQEAGVEMVDFGGSDAEIEDFFRLMVVGNEQKRNFLSNGMKSYLKDIITSLGTAKSLKLSFFKLQEEFIAAIVEFYFKDDVLLYNSGFNPKFSYLSPGLILKVYAIKSAIEEGKGKYDFLRGGERYKYDLGGKERNLYKITF